jgi:hypothetical protein
MVQHQVWIKSNTKLADIVLFTAFTPAFILPSTLPEKVNSLAVLELEGCKINNFSHWSDEQVIYICLTIFFHNTYSASCNYLL